MHYFDDNRNRDLNKLKEAYAQMLNPQPVPEVKEYSSELSIDELWSFDAATKTIHYASPNGAISWGDFDESEAEVLLNADRSLQHIGALDGAIAMLEAEADSRSY